MFAVGPHQRVETWSIPLGYSRRSRATCAGSWLASIIPTLAPPEGSFVTAFAPKANLTVEMTTEVYQHSHRDWAQTKGDYLWSFSLYTGFAFHRTTLAPPGLNKYATRLNAPDTLARRRRTSHLPARRFFHSTICQRPVVWLRGCDLLVARMLPFSHLENDPDASVYQAPNECSCFHVPRQSFWFLAVI